MIPSPDRPSLALRGGQGGGPPSRSSLHLAGEGREGVPRWTESPLREPPPPATTAARPTGTCCPVRAAASATASPDPSRRSACPATRRQAVARPRPLPRRVGRPAVAAARWPAPP